MDPADAAAKAAPRTVGVIPVHLYGHPADLDAIREALCAERGLWMLEDCAQAHGAAWQGRKVGGFGRAGCFSFYPSKNLTVMGDGGVVVTDDDDIAARCRRLRDHGRLNKDVHSELGFNLRFNEIQAAIGRVLLRRLDEMNDRRRALAARYVAGLAGLPLGLPSEAAGARHVYHLSSCARPAATSWPRPSRRAASRPASTTRCRVTASRPSSARVARRCRDRGARERDPDAADLRRPHRGRGRRGGRGGPRVLRSLMAGGPLRVLQLYPKADYFTGAAIQLQGAGVGASPRAAIT